MRTLLFELLRQPWYNIENTVPLPFLAPPHRNVNTVLELIMQEGHTLGRNGDST